MVNLEWYRTFKAIYQTGNLTKAAHELFISQPNVSIQLAALESYVGYKLFDRTPRRMVPTEYGKLLYTQVVASVENLEKVELDFRKTALKQKLILKVGMPYEFFYNEIIKNLPSLTARLTVKFGLTKDLINRLEDDTLDFVVATQKIESPQIQYIPLQEETLFVVGSALLDTDKVDEFINENKLSEIEKWFLDHNWIAYNSELALIRRFWKENFSKRPAIVPQYIIPDLRSLVRVLEQGQSLSIIPDHIVKNEIFAETIKCIWKGISPVKNMVYLSYKKKKVTADQLTEMKKMLNI